MQALSDGKRREPGGLDAGPGGGLFQADSRPVVDLSLIATP